ncbi:unnamed protein product [Rotaria sordida]|uniref:Ig-like domain-containing protein n=1 Tax=Rotaria sordida TaxID=392033 RepID=A0A813N7C2_9BILA|nr:unnamed protein product [Rotaria sordida]
MPYTSPVLNNMCATDDVPSTTCDGPYKNMWWKVTPASSGIITAISCTGNTNFDNELAVFTGACGSMTAVTCNDDNGAGCTSNYAGVTFNACAGVTYYISMGSFYSAGVTGNMQLNVTFAASSALSAGSFTNNTENICPGGDPSNIGGTSNVAASGGTGTLTYLWEYADNGSGTWTSIAGANGATYDPPSGLTGVTYRTYRRRVTDVCGATAVTSNTGVVTLYTVSVAPTSITGTTSICNGESTTLTLSGGSAGTGAAPQWFAGSCGSTVIGTGTSITVSPTTTTTYFVRYNGTCNTTTCASGAVTVTQPVGNPATFPSGSWAVYGYIGYNFNTYAGNYTFTGLNVNTESQWGNLSTPSAASGWVGCTVPVDLHSYSIKRQNFPCGTYEIRSINWDDDVVLNVNGGGAEWSATCCGTADNTVRWTGQLNSASTVEITIADGGGGSRAAFNIVDVTPTLVAGNAGDDQAICSGTDLNFNTAAASTGGAINPSYSYLWEQTTVSGCGSGWAAATAQTGNNTSQTFDPPALTQTTCFRRTTTDCRGITAVDVFTVTVNTFSVAPTGITGTTTICNGNSTTLTVAGGTVGTGVTVQWFTGSCGGTSAGTGNSITVSPTSTTTYYVRYAGTCNTTTCASTSVTVNTLSVAPTGITGTTTICNGGSTTLTVAGGTVGTGVTVQWFTGSCGGTSAGTGNSITVSPTSTTTYYVRYAGTCNTTTCASTSVTVNTPSVAPTGITGTTTICNGGSTTLTVAGGTVGTGVTVEWFTGSCGGTSAGTGNSITVSPTSTTTYYVRYAGTCNTTTCASTSVTVNQPSVAPTGITGTTTICNGGSTTLTVAGGTVGTGVTVQWFTGSCGGTSAGTGNSITVSPTSTTTYYVRYAGTCNTTTCASTSVTVNTPSVAPTGITGTTTICNGNSTTLTVAGGTVGTGVTVEWFTGSCGGTSAGTGNSITVSPTSTTTYYVRYNGTCNTTTCASTSVTVNQPSVAPTGITGTTTICNGGSTTLTVAGGTVGTGVTVEWFTASCGGTSAGTGNSITVSPTSTTTYYVRYAGTCNTTTCASTSVTVNTLSTPPTGITGTTTICNGNSTTLTLTGGSLGTGAAPQWFAGSCGSAVIGTGNSITVSPSSSTTYYVRYNGTCNATTCASSAVTVQTGPIQRTVAVVSSTICSNTAGTVQVISSESGTVYQLYNTTDAVNVGATQTGNGTTLSFSTGNLTADKSFKVIASRTPCTAVDMNIGVDVTIYVVNTGTWKGSVSTDWFDSGNWCLGGGIPTSVIDVVIPNEATTNFDPIINAANAVCRTISLNTSGILTISGTRNLDVYGDWDNSGIFNYNASTVTFKGASTANIGGFTDPQEFNNLKVDKGTNATPILDLNGNVTVYGALQPTNGTIRVSGGDLTLSSATTIASTSGVAVAGGNLVAGSLGFTNNGAFSVSSGNAAVGSLTNNSGSTYLTTGGVTTVASNVANTGSTVNASGGSVTVSGAWSNTSSSLVLYTGSTIAVVGNYSSTGSTVNANSATVSIGGNYTNTSSTLALGGAVVTVAGNMVNATGTVNQTAGSLTLNTIGGSYNSNAVLDFDGASSMNISGGNIYLQRANAGSGNDLVILSGAGTKTITGGTIHFGNGSTPASQVFKVNNSVVDFNSVTIAGNNAPTLRLLANAATRSTGILAVNGVLDLNGKIFTVKNGANTAITRTAPGYVSTETQDDKPHYENGRVYISDEQYFDKVPQLAW